MGQRNLRIGCIRAIGELLIKVNGNFGGGRGGGFGSYVIIYLFGFSLCNHLASIFGI